MAELVRPSLRYIESYLAALEEYKAEGREMQFNVHDVEGEIERILQKRDSPLPEKVPESVYWLVEGETYIGDFKLRHELNDFLRTFGGHIGYQVRPTERRKGYGTLGLRLLLDEARKFGLTRVMLTCDTDNTGSRRIIEENGGIVEVERRVSWHANPYLCWWIELA